MDWLLVAIISYFLFAIVALGDKYVLAGPQNPKTYTFYVGILSVFVVALIPFVGFFIPSLYSILLALLAGSLFLFSLLGLFEGLENFEASRIIPAIGGILPLFTMVLVFFFSLGAERLGITELIAFAFLLLGSILITRTSSTKISLKSLQIAVITAFLFALYFLLVKYVYLDQPFWNGFIWIRLGTLFTALLFLFTKDVRRGLAGKRPTFDKITGPVFIVNQVIGVSAAILQNWAVALAGIAYLAVINALQGVQYAILFVLTAFISLKFPKILKEKITKKIMLQKGLAICSIVVGLLILSLM